MKKLFATISGVTASILAPAVAFAQSRSIEPWNNFIPRGSFPVNDFPRLIQTVILWFLIFAMVFAVIYAIWGGYQYITSAGDAEKATAGRNTLVNAIIGLIIIGAAYAIIGWVYELVLTT
ncbi:MAG: hypothetical protein ABH837_02695 [bacterium]